MKLRLTIKRVIWALVLLAVCAYFLNSYLENRAKERAEQEAEQEKVERIKHSIRSAINEMVSRFDAVNDWEQKLCKGQTIRTEKILTIELEKLWLGKRPILFMGSIEDISTIDEKTYRLRMHKPLLSSIANMILTPPLALEIKCNKTMLDQFLEAHPKLFSDFGVKNCIAVIAKIDEIRTEHSSRGEGTREEIRVGVGDCLGITLAEPVKF